MFEKREDGYHELHSLFWKRPSPEVIEIAPTGGPDRLIVSGAEITGENLLIKACRWIRSRYGADALPPMAFSLSKFLPQGSGVGAGSGNAAALLRWFYYDFRPELRADLAWQDIAPLGADVAFLASNFDLALAEGVGERLQGLPAALDLPGLIAFPEWASNTGVAYQTLDAAREAGSLRPPERNAAQEESVALLEALRRKKKLGLLPNDFISCLSSYKLCYNSLYETFDKFGALAWGLCGSGSACFALFDSADDRSRLTAFLSGEGASNFSWLRQILVLE